MTSSRTSQATATALGKTTAVNRPRVALIIFARFPVPGQVKTRLIPVLGVERAATLHERFTHRTLEVARQFRIRHGADIQIHHAGGTSDAMRSRFPGATTYCLQRGDDFGARLATAVTSAFAHGFRKVIVIGTDCPDLNSEQLAETVKMLDHVDVVLGPATDGGYYLIGLNTMAPTLFQEIDWGTDKVLAQTCRKIRELRLTSQQLSPLPDVDYAEDLLACRRYPDSFGDLLPREQAGVLSIIVPARNEETNIRSFLSALPTRDDQEIIVVDGGSVDRTLQIAERLGATTLSAPRGRGAQMNAGAAFARGATLLFLHADTLLPTGFESEIRRLLDHDETVFGAFRLRVRDDRLALRLIEHAANLRSRFRGLPYGDQALFIKSQRFYNAGGFQSWPLMEDYEFSRRLRRQGKVAISQHAVQTSGRRWQRKGVLRTSALNQLFVAAYHCGVSPQRLAEWYYGRKP